MLLVRIFKGLWWCTLIGGIIKHYSYYMVPFIVAENPDIAPRTAIRLSRRMMKGHKWECFVHELSFLGWTILGSLTLGVSNILFMNPYTTAFFTEYYAELRRLAKEKQIEDADLLNDNYLFEKADLKTLANTYPDIIAAASQPQITLSDLKGFQKFIADTFGVTFRRSKAEQAYEKDQARVTRIGREIAAAEGRVYPTRLSPFPSDAKREWIGTCPLYPPLFDLVHYRYFLCPVLHRLDLGSQSAYDHLRRIRQPGRTLRPMAADLRYRQRPDLITFK